MEYVKSSLWDLVSVIKNPELKSFCELNSIVNLAIGYREVAEDEENERWEDWLFELAVKFDRCVGKVTPLGERDHKWLEKWCGAILTVQKIDQYNDGGGYVYYSMHKPIAGARKEMDPDFPDGPRWAGGEWE